MKKLLAITLIAIMALAFTITASANFDLGAMNWENNANQIGWRVDGVDGVATNLTWETLESATALRLTISNNPAGDDIHLVFQGDGNDWAWGQYVFKSADCFVADASGTGGVITLPFAEHPHWDAIKGGEMGKFLIGYWGDGSMNVANLGITNAVLVVPGGGGGGAAQTGVSFLLFPALGLVALGTTGAIVVGKKIKK